MLCCYPSAPQAVTRPWRHPGGGCCLGKSLFLQGNWLEKGAASPQNAAVSVHIGVSGPGCARDVTAAPHSPTALTPLSHPGHISVWVGDLSLTQALTSRFIKQEHGRDLKGS